MHERVTSKTKRKKREGEPSLSQARDNRSLSKKPSTKLDILHRTKSKVESEQNNNNTTTNQEGNSNQMEVEMTNLQEKKVDQEPNFYSLSNPSRVLEKQRRFIQYLDNERYKPLVPERK